MAPPTKNYLKKNWQHDFRNCLIHHSQRQSKSLNRLGNSPTLNSSSRKKRKPWTTSLCLKNLCLTQKSRRKTSPMIKLVPRQQHLLPNSRQNLPTRSQNFPMS